MLVSAFILKIIFLKCANIIGYRWQKRRRMNSSQTHGKMDKWEDFHYDSLRIASSNCVTKSVKSNSFASCRKHAVAGCTAGLSTVLALQPLDVIKTRLQVQDGAGSLPMYRGTADALQSIGRQEGWKALYSGTQFYSSFKNAASTDKNTDCYFSPNFREEPTKFVNLIPFYRSHTSSYWIRSSLGSLFLCI